jgi:hypothetical protein
MTRETLGSLIKLLPVKEYMALITALKIANLRKAA